MTNRTPSHPTRERLIETMTELLEESPQDIKVDTLLARSGISIGSLYHHFDDLDHLVEIAYIRRFSATVELSVGVLAHIAATANSQKEVLEALGKVTRATQAQEIASTRFERARIVAMTENNERFATVMRSEQQRLSSAITDLIREAQERGWYSNDFDPAAAAVLIQAYTLGRVVDDVAEEPVDPDAWIALIDRLIERTFAAE
jgi:AcrR family transcriptional regulator